MAQRASEAGAQELETGLRSLGIANPGEVSRQLLAYAQLLLEANRRTNLVGVKTVSALIGPHLLDSLAPLAGMPLESPVLDLGSGAGLPGIPAAIAWPNTRFVLVEPRAKRVQFLKTAVKELGLRNVEVAHAGAQGLAAQASAGGAGTVLARALAKADAAVRLALPLLHPGGKLVLYQGRAARPTPSQRRAIARIGGRVVEARRVEVPYLEAQRHVWVIEKRPPRIPDHSGPPALRFHRERFSTLDYKLRGAFDRLLAQAFPQGGVYAVGGSVRDEVLGQLGRPQPNRPDLDYLVTGVPAPQLLEVLSALGQAELVGASFGVIKFTRDGVTVDVALPRRERAVGPRHRDFEVQSAPDIPLEEDLARRDFRINMLARDVRSGTVIDPYGGRADLEARRLDVLRPEAFAEDALRILRGAQFAARFELIATPATLDAMRAATERIESVAPERIADELTKLLTLSTKPSTGFELLRDTGALAQFMPELLEGWGVEQNEFHAYTVYEHSLRACDEAPQDLVVRLAALLHDVGKPRTKEGPHFYGHEHIGEEMTRTLLERLRFGSEIVERVSRLVGLHMYTTVDQVSDAGVRRFIRRVGPANINDLFALRHADIRATGLPARDENQNARFEGRVAAELQAGRALGIADLEIDGQDIIRLMRELGLAGEDFAGDSRVGAALRGCLEHVLDHPSENNRDALLKRARSVLESSSGTA